MNTIEQSITYYPVANNWRKLKPIFESQYISEFCRAQLWDMYEERAEQNNWTDRLIATLQNPLSRPKDLNISDWRCDRRGRPPEWHDYVVYRACHYMGRVYHEVISMVEPNECWSLVKSQAHTTCWNRRRNILFDPQFQALGISARETFNRATVNPAACEKQPVEHAPA